MTAFLLILSLCYDDAGKAVAALEAKGASVSAVLLSESGKALFTHDPDRLLVPASTVKLFTAAAALVEMGGQGRFRTTFTLSGDTIYVQGEGDPSIEANDILALAGAFSDSGFGPFSAVAVVNGFAGGFQPPSASLSDISHAYSPPTASLCADWGVLLAYAEPAGVDVGVDFAPVNLAFSEGEPSIGLLDGELWLYGRMPEVTKRELVVFIQPDPVLYFGHLIKWGLEASGIKAGPVIEVPAAKGDTLFVFTSVPLSSAVSHMLKKSDNFIAQMLFRSLSETGEWAASEQVVSENVKLLGVKGLFRLVDGSGLSRYSLLSARDVAVLLYNSLKDKEIGPSLYQALPKGGQGTLNSRLKGTDIRAKTGTLSGVHALSGYAGKRPFSILVNGYIGSNGAAREALDRIAISFDQCE